jgi:hypothetical protein
VKPHCLILVPLLDFSAIARMQETHKQPRADSFLHGHDNAKQNYILVPFPMKNELLGIEISYDLKLSFCNSIHRVKEICIFLPVEEICAGNSLLFLCIEG